MPWRNINSYCMCFSVSIFLIYLPILVSSHIHPNLVTLFLSNILPMPNFLARPFKIYKMAPKVKSILYFCMNILFNNWEYGWKTGLALGKLLECIDWSIDIMIDGDVLRRIIIKRDIEWQWKHVFHPKCPMINWCISKIWGMGVSINNILARILMIKGKPLCKKNLWQTEFSLMRLEWRGVCGRSGWLDLALSAVMLTFGNSFLEIRMPVVFYLIVCSSRQVMRYLRPPKQRDSMFIIIIITSPIWHMHIEQDRYI